MTENPSPMTQEILQACLQKAGLRAVWRTASPGLWDEVLQAISYVPIFYTEFMLDYQFAYSCGNGVEVQDLSMIIYHDNQPVAVWPLCLRQREGWALGSSEGAVLPPLFIEYLASKSVKMQVGACLAFIEEVSRRLGITAWQSMEPFTPSQFLSEWHCQTLRRGASVRVMHGLYVDLTMDLAAIKSCFRKSYKALITSGSKLWQVGVLSQADAGVWQEFRALHGHVTGRSTRSDDTWNRQLDAIRQSSSFLVHLRNDQNRMVGGGFFQVSRDEGLYAVAAYDRDLFDKPLGHVVQYHAMQEMQRRGLKWYCIGARLYPSDQPAPTAKELAISEFKEGFATHYFARFMLSCPLSPASASAQDGAFSKESISG